MSSNNIHRKLIDDFIMYFDGARCAVGRAAKLVWVDKIKKALDVWLEKQ